MALVTTVIPTFRRPRVLKGAIESVLAQTFADFEVNVYDDASGDDTATVVQSISSRDPRVHYFCHPKRLGMMANFGYGSGASGECDRARLYSRPAAVITTVKSRFSSTLEWPLSRAPPRVPSARMTNCFQGTVK